MPTGVQNLAVWLRETCKKKGHKDLITHRNENCPGGKSNFHSNISQTLSKNKINI